ncbi:MAG: hypothetical protein PHG71_09290, partial [Kiritimatiellae bacterium]|nr:hypothetical protein [Kiritimatiellia bacterium]
VAYALWRYLPRDISGVTVAFLRVIFFTALLWVLLLPGRKSSLVEIAKPLFVVLLDTSASMEQSADESAGRTRWEAAMETLKLPWAKTVQAKCVMDVYPFNADLDKPVELAQTAALRPEGRSTRLNLGLNRLFERLRGQELASVMVLSDAIDTREKNDNWAESGWPAPIYAVQLEPSVELDDTPDMRVDNADTPRRAIVGWDTAMTVTVAGYGGKGEPFPVILLKDGKESDKAVMQLPPEGGSRDVQFKLAHPEIGTETYTVRIPPLPGESQTNDNEMIVAVDVLDARNRVLFLEDLPRFESKHMSRALFDNKDITPLAFFQMPSRKLSGAKEWVAYGDRQGLSFDLTLDQLRLNKIIILGNFDADAISSEHCRTILEFVEQGGSLILLGGQKLWGDNGIAHTDLAKLLPFKRAGAPAMEGRFNVNWTAEGRAHPALANNPDMPAALPPVLSVFTGAALSGGAFALAEAVTDSGSHPILVSRVYGQGKVLAVLTDSLWRWAMQPGEERPYQKFWRQIIQWMSPSESGMDKYHLELFTDAGTIAVGDPAILQGRLVIPPEETRRSWRVRCAVTTPSDRSISLNMTGRDLGAGQGAAVPGYMAEFTPNEAGNYRAVATVEIDGKKIESSACLFTVRATSQETVLRPVNERVLKALARSSGGRHGTPEEIDAALQDLRVTERRERKLEYRALWQTPFILACLIAILALEWVFRKLKNMS